MLYFDKQTFKNEKSWHLLVTHTNKCLQNLEAPSTGHILQTSKTANYLPVIFQKPQNRAKKFHSGSPIKIFITKKREIFTFLEKGLRSTFYPMTLFKNHRLFYTNAILMKQFRVSSM